MLSSVIITTSCFVVIEVIKVSVAVVVLPLSKCSFCELRRHWGWWQSDGVDHTELKCVGQL